MKERSTTKTSNKQPDRHGRIPLSLKFPEEQVRMLRLCAQADGRTLSNFIAIHFLATLTQQTVESLSKRNGHASVTPSEQPVAK